MNRRRFLSGATAAAAASVAATGDASAPQAAVTAQPAAKARAGAPNILVFMPDQQVGATVLAGHPCLTPHLDHFREQSVTFREAHCPAPHCCPSRASFMTGLYPSEHGVFNNVMTDTAIHTDPYPGTPFFSESLKSAGYQLGYAGKYHVGRNENPQKSGWTSFSELEEDSYAEYAKRQTAKAKSGKIAEHSPAERTPGEVLRPDWDKLQSYVTLPDGGPKGYEGLADYKIMQAGIAGMKTMAAAGKPWCIMISNSGGHDPYNAPKKFVDMYDPAKVELPASYSDMMDDKPRVYQRQRYQYWAQMSREEATQSLIHYWAKLTMQDAIFGELLASLEQTGQADNTIVVYVSDHGDYAAAHGLWMKGVPSFREAYNIPCILRWPKAAGGAGRIVDAFVSSVDFAPTFLEAAGISSPKPLSGRSLLPWLKGETPADWRDAIFTQLNGVELYYTQRIITTRNYKYVYNGFDYDELYDLKADPHETRNLAFPDLAAKRVEVESGRGLAPNGHVPWPQLSPPLEAVREDLLSRMWRFAREHNDQLFNPYGTVALAPYGPALSAGDSPRSGALNTTKNAPLVSQR